MDFGVFFRKFEKVLAAAGWTYLFCVPVLCLVLPEYVGDENGPVENMQLVWLGFSALYLFQQRKFQMKSWGGNQFSLCCAGIIVFLLGIGRELSWGRVVFIDEAGNMPQWTDLGIWAEEIVHGLVIVLILICIYLLWRGRIDLFLLSIWRQLDWSQIGLLLIFIGAQYVDEHTDWESWKGYLDEELNELGAYYVMWYLTVKTMEDYKKL